MKSLAIIGTGIAGMGCAHYLRQRYAITLYERENYPGGHTNTVMVSEQKRQAPVDTGFMVFNRETYPNMLRLFKDLGIEPMPTSMSFSVRHDVANLEYSGTSLNHLFAQRSNLLRPSFWKMIRDIVRFNKESEALLADASLSSMALIDYVQKQGFGREFLDHYLVPMSAAIWSAERDVMLRFPAATLIRFFKNHGLLGVRGHLQWYTLKGGSRTYRDKLLAPLSDGLKLECAATKVVRESGKVTVYDAHGGKATYDEAIIATHGDEALSLLGEGASSLERELLSKFHYSQNYVQLHTDTSVMPRRKLAWSSWNYRVDPGVSAGPVRSSTHYWMNLLQKVSDHETYIVSVNGQHLVDGGKVIKTFNYTHPIFDLPAMRAQKRLQELNREGPLFFCGSYFRYGFHEDALRSALHVVERLTGERFLAD